MSLAPALVTALAVFASQPAGEVIDFSATYCGPCREMSPIVERLEREGLPIRKVDIEQNRALAEKYRVDKIPTFLLVINGKEVTRIVGRTSEAELRRLCRRIPQAAAQPDDPLLVNGSSAATVPATHTPQPRTGIEPPLGTEVAQSDPRPRGFWDRLKRSEPKSTARGNDAELEPQAATPTNDPMDASVRIRVTINDAINLGSGTVVDSRPGRTLIVTCGHIFRNMNDQTKVDVDLFIGGRPKTYVATVVSYDLEADVGLISVATDKAVSWAPIAPPSVILEKAQRVACIGCSGGNDPSREQLMITAINKYTGPDNIECTGTPVQGRSGGGLFNADGQLIGVCIAADQQADRGLYAHAFAIHKLLDKCNLSHLYQPQPAREVLADATDAATEQPESTEDVAAEVPENTVADGAEPAAPATDVAAAAPTSEPDANVAAEADPAEMADIPVGDAEVVIIIRSRSQPESQSRVVIINRASPKFLAYLNGELRPAAENVATSSITPTSRKISASTAAAAQSAPDWARQTTETRRPTSEFQPPRLADSVPGRSLPRRAATARTFLPVVAK